MATTQDNSMVVAETIIEQLGGKGPLTAMIGVKHFIADEKSVQIRFGGGAINKANSCIITLNDDDTYTVRFAKVGRAPRFDVTECGTTSMVYADSLRKHFENTTGFYLSL